MYLSELGYSELVQRLFEKMTFFLVDPLIQATKGKSFDSYRTHLAKSVDAWCCLHHINRDKSIFL